MTALPLVVHPADPSPPELSVTAAVELAGDETGEGVWLRYTLSGHIQTLVLPAPCSAGPADGLWRHTCLEAFVQQGDGPGYREFNLSPSGQWAAYRFSTERVRVSGDVPPPIGPTITLQRTPHTLTLNAWVPRALLPSRPGAIGLSAVIQSQNGLTHWALHHPRPERPDFHHAGGWIHRLSLPSSFDPQNPA